MAAAVQPPGGLWLYPVHHWLGGCDWSSYVRWWLASLPDGTTDVQPEKGERAHLFYSPLQGSCFYFFLRFFVPLIFFSSCANSVLVLGLSTLDDFAQGVVGRARSLHSTPWVMGMLQTECLRCLYY